MKKLSLLFSFIALSLSAQSQRFVYEYRFVPDSTNAADAKTELMNLDVNKEGSRFYSYTAYQSDSTMRINLEKQLKASGMINVDARERKGSVRYSVSKTYPDYKVFLHNRVLMDSYKVADERPINWKITQEKQKLENWTVQKAETDFGGRHWIAWFTTDIPIQDGPYKFHGLPGLIVKLEDKTQSHQFDLKAVKNFDGQIPKEVFKGNEIAINSKQYDKIVDDYEKDPTKGMKQMQMGGIVMQMSGGNENHMKEQEKRMIERLKKDNNRIELKKKN